MMLTAHRSLTSISTPSKACLSLFTKIRDQTTPPAQFAQYADRLMTILAEETVAEIAVNPVTVQTPVAAFEGVEIDVNDLCAVSIIRAGDSLLDCVRKILPGISVGKILIQRDEETALPKMYYAKLPNGVENKTILLCDPMLATGGSAIMAIESLVSFGVDPSKIIFSNVVSCPEGIAAMYEKYPMIKIVTAAIDEGLNDKKFIVPGLGDYGDRYFNTA
jgi:uracil phosphoribosyltransferase